MAASLLSPGPAFSSPLNNSMHLHRHQSPVGAPFAPHRAQNGQWWWLWPGLKFGPGGHNLAPQGRHHGARRCAWIRWLLGIRIHQQLHQVLSPPRLSHLPDVGSVSSFVFLFATPFVNWLQISMERGSSIAMLPILPSPSGSSPSRREGPVAMFSNC